MNKTISIGKKKIEELLQLPQFAGHSYPWAYSALRANPSESPDAQEFRQYVLDHCHGYIITKKKF